MESPQFENLHRQASIDKELEPTEAANLEK